MATDRLVSDPARLWKGCPSSGSLFALALDPFLRYIYNGIPQQLSLRAFADDMGCLLVDLTANFHRLAAGFASLALATCLQVHPAKTQLCLLLNPQQDELGDILQMAWGDWSQSKVVEAIKLPCLG